MDSKRQNHAHPTVLAAAKIILCTACQESARMLCRLVSSGKIKEPGAVQILTSSTGIMPPRRCMSKSTLLVDASSSGCGPDLANCIPLGASWKCIGVGSEADAKKVVVQVLLTTMISPRRM